MWLLPHHKQHGVWTSQHAEKSQGLQHRLWKAGETIQDTQLCRGSEDEPETKSKNRVFCLCVCWGVLKIADLTVNSTFQQIKHELLTLSKKDHSQYDCCVVIMLSHGTEVRHAELILMFIKKNIASLQNNQLEYSGNTQDLIFFTVNILIFNWQMPLCDLHLTGLTCKTIFANISFLRWITTAFLVPCTVWTDSTYQCSTSQTTSMASIARLCKANLNCSSSRPVEEVAVRKRTV